MEILKLYEAVEYYRRERTPLLSLEEASNSVSGATASEEIWVNTVRILSVFSMSFEARTG